MSEKWTRTIPVSREWFEQLESYLQADERFSSSMDSFNELLVNTLEGKRIIFKVDEAAQ